MNNENSIVEQAYRRGYAEGVLEVASVFLDKDSEIGGKVKEIVRRMRVDDWQRIEGKEIIMLDLKNYPKAIKIHSQEELGHLKQIFRDAGVEVLEDLKYYEKGWEFFTKLKFGWSLYQNRAGKGVIEYKDFIKEFSELVGKPVKIVEEK